MSNSLFVLVTGGTGRQGGSVARNLLKHGYRVRVFTRNEDGRAAMDLRRLGAEIFVGDFEDSKSLERSMREVTSVFAMTTPDEKGIETEIRHGKNIADVAKKAGVSHYVYSSAASANRSTGVPLLEGKAQVEHWIRNLGLPYTLIGAVSFMENLLRPSELAELARGRVSAPLPGSSKLQQIALEDFAAFVTLVLEHRDQFLGRRFDIASDELNGLRAAEVLGNFLGHELIYSEVPSEELRAQNSELASFYEWLRGVGTSVNIELLRRQFPEVGWQSYEKWVRAQDWSLLSARSAE